MEYDVFRQATAAPRGVIPAVIAAAALLGVGLQCADGARLAAKSPDGQSATASAAAGEPRQLQMRWGDTSRRGRPFAKDPSVIRFQGRYLLYYSIPSFDDGRQNDGWGVGIAESRNLREWTKVGEFVASEPYEAKGVAAPFAMVLDGKVHLFYQTYGNASKDAICHATSTDGLHFERDATNPIFRPSGAWTVGRAIDAEVVRHNGRWFLYVATRDPEMKVQMLAGAVSDGGFERNAWHMLADRPLLKPELPWEQDCIEAPTVLRHGKTLFMFYAGAYNNAPQQIGLARSTDGVTWTRMSDQPFLRHGAPGTWNSSESGHPGVFVDEDGTPYLFYQGNDDNGRTWLLSFVRLSWRNDEPALVGAGTSQGTSR
jgi:beta-1,2-mannobiose phosphorylase / 1,2-beta-oligomannan phosphorylase